MKDRVYLDWNATAPLRDVARDAMVDTMSCLGNPSAVHAEGRAARSVVERARGQVAAAIGCKPQEVVFTSGATEAASVLSRFSYVVAEPTCHDALWAHHSVDPAAPTDPADILAIGLVNSETGVILDLPDRQDGGFSYNGTSAKRLLVDATQALGRVPFSFAWSQADFAILSAHKLGGPKGVGALIIREGTDVATLLQGGGQEMGRRSGTENIIGIAGFGAAAEAAMQELEAGAWAEVAKLRNILETALETAVNQINFVGNDQQRAPGTSCFSVPGWKGETQVMQMDLAGFAISAGSACSSGKVRESRVLQAMGYSAEIARSAIRVSMGPATTQEDVMLFVDAWTAQYKKFAARAA